MQTSKFWLTLILGFGFFVLLVGTLRGANGIEGYLRLSTSAKILNTAIESLELENEKLADEIERIQESPEYAERVLRDKYHLRKDGERIVFFAN